MAFVIRDEILAPKGSIFITYNGSNPLKVYGAIPQLLRLFFEVKGKDITERELRWDLTEDPRPFRIVFWADKGMDKFTKLKIIVTLVGEQPTNPSKSGKMDIELTGFLETKFESENPFVGAILIPLIQLYHLIFYSKIRRRYIEYGKRGIEKLEQELRKTLNIPLKET